MLKTQLSEKFLHGEVNLIIQYIIVQDQDGQNININIELTYDCKQVYTNNNNDTRILHSGLTNLVKKF